MSHNYSSASSFNLRPRRLADSFSVMSQWLLFSLSRVHSLLAFIITRDSGKSAQILGIKTDLLQLPSHHETEIHFLWLLITWKLLYSHVTKGELLSSKSDGLELNIDMSSLFIHS